MPDKSKLLDRNRLGAIGIALAVVLFFAINILSGTLLKSTRLDLTADKLFTLSTGTEQVLSTMEEPVDLRLYYSSRLDELGPYFSAHAQRVEELLGEYQRLSGGRVQLERLDPQPFSPEEDLAVAEGLEGLPLSGDGTQAYFGLSGRNSTDDIEVIGYLAPERANFLEYDLTRLVHDLASPDKPVVAVLGDLPLIGTQFNQFQPWHVLDAVYQFFDVRFLGGKQEQIDDDVEVLMLAQPHNVDQATLYAIDQFVMRGGRVLAFVDPLAEVMAAGGGMNPMANPEGNAIAALEPLLTAWGISIPDGQVIGDYLPWLSLDASHLNADDVITGDIRLVNLNSAGAIHAREGATTAIEPLVVSSELSMPIETDQIRNMPDPAKLIAAFAPSGERFVLAARVTGAAKSAFPDGPPDGVTSDAAHLAEATAPLNLVVIADADLLADATWVRQQDLLGQQIVIPIANNGDFAINALDHLAGSQGLISLRGRGLIDRPFEVVRAMEQEAEYKYRAKEQELLARIDETEAKIRQLKEEEQKSGVILTAAQQEEIENFRGEMIKLRQELRAVQRSLREDVESLSTRIKALNIWAVPILVALLAAGLAGFQRMRASRAARSAA